MKLKYSAILAIFALSLIASAILSFIPLEQACGGIQSTCYAVQTSNYENTFGIKNSYLGLIAFSIVSLLTISQIRNPKKSKKKIINLAIILASIIAIYFIYIQFFVLNAVCKYCMIIDVGAIINLGIIFFIKENETKN